MAYEITFDGDDIVTNTGVPSVSGTRLAAFDFEEGSYPKKNIFEPMPLGDGEYMKPNGYGAAVHRLSVDIFCPTASVASVRSHFRTLNLNDEVGTLSVPDFGSFTNCAVESVTGPGPMRRLAIESGGTEGYLMHYEITFRQII